MRPRSSPFTKMYTPFGLNMSGEGGLPGGPIRTHHRRSSPFIVLDHKIMPWFVHAPRNRQNPAQSVHLMGPIIPRSKYTVGWNWKLPWSVLTEKDNIECKIIPNCNSGSYFNQYLAMLVENSISGRFIRTFLLITSLWAHIHRSKVKDS